MTERKILAFYSPYPGAGKSQAALAALIHWFPRCKIYSFAEPVRDIVSSILRGLSVGCLLILGCCGMRRTFHSADSVLGH